MKILLTVQNFPPDVGGMAEVAKQMALTLRKKGHRVFVATSKNNNRVFENKEKFIFEFDPHLKKERLAYIDFVVLGQWDVVVNLAAQQWATDLLLPHLEKIKAKKILVPTGFSGLHLKSYRQYYDKLPAYLEKYDHLIFHGLTGQDFIFANRIVKEKWSVIPNGASLEEFRTKEFTKIREKYNVLNHQKLIISIGSHNGLKGHDQAIELFKAADIKDATLLIIGNFYSYNILRKIYNLIFRNNACPQSCLKLLKKTYIDEKSNKTIKVISVNRQETIDLLFAADLFLFLSKVECSPIVLYEAMASQTPFLSTEVGNVKEIISWTEAGELLSQDKTKAKEQLENLLADADRLKRLGLNGRTAFLEKFNWENIGLWYEKCFEKVLSQ